MNIVSPLETGTPLTMPHGRGARLVISLFPRQLQGLVLQLREDWRTHYFDWTQPGFRAVAAHRFGSWVDAESGKGLVRGPIRSILRRLHLTMFRYVRNHYGIELPVTAIVGRRVELGAGATILGPVTIGDGARIGPHSVVMTDVPPGATVFVNPPRMISLRSVAPANTVASAPALESQAAGAAR